MTPTDTLAGLLAATGLPPSLLHQADITGQDPALPSSFRVSTAAAASVAAAGLAAAALWQQRTGRTQRVAVDMRHACAEFHSEKHLMLHGRPAPTAWDDIAGLYPTADGWVRIHTNFPHHRAGLLHLLDVEDTADAPRDAVARALALWQAEAFETAAAEAQMPAFAARSFAGWDAHPQARAVAGLKLVAIRRIGDAKPEPLPDGDRPLDNIRVLELARVIAGPVCGRVLAAHGADVLAVTAAHLPSVGIEDLGRGKLQTRLDLRHAAGRAALAHLTENAHVFLQGYRPGSLAARGFAPADTARLRPGIVHAELSAWGAEGLWSARRGFDSLVQTATGLNLAEAEAAGQAAPRPLPLQALDHATGFLLATGVMAALHRRAVEGGSWHVEVSLARTGHWLRSLGRVAQGFAATAPDIQDLLEDSASGFGPMRAIRHAAILSETPAGWTRPSRPLGVDPPNWPSKHGALPRTPPGAEPLDLDLLRP